MHIYFSGIGGVAIGPLAMLAQDAGYQVSGSDLAESEMTELLRKRGVEVAIGQDGSAITAIHTKTSIDWFVHSSALPESHPELSFAQKQGIKISKRSELINQVIRDKNLKLIAVSGTHGKTTTTGMLVWLFKQLGLPVSYSIGTTISFGPPAQYQAGSEYFVYECDEFDRNFLDFQPEISLITSLDHDHADTYPSEADYLAAFNQFASQSKLCITWQSVADKLEVSPALLVLPDDRALNWVPLVGEHNRRNGWLAATPIDRKVQPSDGSSQAWQNLLAKLKDFPGTNRRFEKLADNLYSDYGHHPTEIAATIQMAREVNQQVVVVYQPHQNIRQHELLGNKGYKDCFNGAKKVYWLTTYLSREYKDLDMITPDRLIASSQQSDIIEQAEMNRKLWQNITEAREAGSLVLCMSAGNLDAWLRAQLKTGPQES